MATAMLGSISTSLRWNMATVMRLLLVSFCVGFYLNGLLLFPFLYVIVSHIIVSFWIGFELNLPLDEYGAINFDFEENLTGKINFF